MVMVISSFISMTINLRYSIAKALQTIYRRNYDKLLRLLQITICGMIYNTLIQYWIGQFTNCLSIINNYLSLI